jgi:hypothetical protein
MNSTSLMVIILRMVFTAMMIKEIAVPKAVDHSLSEKYIAQIAIGSTFLSLIFSRSSGAA